jgi:hypothetical protein
MGFDKELFYYFLWLCSPARVIDSSFTRLRDHTQRTTVGRTPLDECDTELLRRIHGPQEEKITLPGFPNQ